MILEKLEGLRTGLDIGTRNQSVIAAQLEEYVDELHTLTSSTCKSFTGDPFFTARLEEHMHILQSVKYEEDEKRVGKYVLCHGDLGWQNILVDWDTMTIKCILDWEYAGFYPKDVEGESWRTLGWMGIREGDKVRDGDQLVGAITSMAVTDEVDPDVRDAEVGVELREEAQVVDEEAEEK